MTSRCSSGTVGRPRTGWWTHGSSGTGWALRSSTSRTTFPRFRLILEDELPEVLHGLVEAGCVSLDALALMPPSIDDRSPRPGDDRFRLLTGRRPVVEGALAKAADNHDGVTVRRGVGVDGLLTGMPAVRALA